MRTHTVFLAVSLLGAPASALARDPGPSGAVHPEVDAFRRVRLRCTEPFDERFERYLDASMRARRAASDLLPEGGEGDPSRFLFSVALHQEARASSVTRCIAHSRLEFPNGALAVVVIPELRAAVEALAASEDHVTRGGSRPRRVGTGVGVVGAATGGARGGDPPRERVEGGVEADQLGP